MHKHKIIQAGPLFAIFLFIALFLPVQVIAEDDMARHTSTFTLYMENDMFYNTDRQYTHGIKLSWISPDLSECQDNFFVPSWSGSLTRCLPFINKSRCRQYVSFSFGQNLYTPEEIERDDLIEDDRPYAGIAYMAVGFHGEDNKQMDTLELNAGIVGRHSYAKDFQRAVHDWVNATNPKGWDHQLHDEPIFNVFFEYKRKVIQAQYGKTFGSDCIFHIGSGIGNAFTGANMGGEMRFGWNMPNDFGTYTIRPGSDSNSPADDSDPRLFKLLSRAGMHIFIGIDGTAVARNILLDGNTFRDSHSVDKNHFVACFVGGLGIIADRFKITYSHVYQTKEFKTQEKDQQYGAISISYTF
jgi:hypothetical protein